MKYLKTIYLLLCCTLALAACSDDDENSASGALSITTPAYTNVGYNKATLSANISGTEGVNIVKRGFCYGTASPSGHLMTRPPKSEDRKSVRP